MCLARLGRVNEAWRAAGPLLDEVIGSSNEDETPLGPLARLLRAAVVLGHGGAAQALMRRLAPVARLSSLGVARGFGTNPARHLGDAAALLGDPSSARAYYMQAHEAATKIRFRPEIALAHLSLAELLLQDIKQGSRAEALQHLDLAIPELRDMHMQPGFERALELSDKHRPSPVPTSARSAASDVLTTREREIARLMAAGLSNHEISERLVITEGTVEVHVKHILSKLGFRSRTQVAVWVAGHGPSWGESKSSNRGRTGSVPILAPPEL